MIPKFLPSVLILIINNLVHPVRHAVYNGAVFIRAIRSALSFLILRLDNDIISDTIST